MNKKLKIVKPRRNDNVLPGVQCPECQSDGMFYISFRLSVKTLVSDDGYDLAGAVVIEDSVADLENWVECCKCRFEGGMEMFVSQERRIEHESLVQRYTLHTSEGDEDAWVGVDGTYDVHIMRGEEGISVDIWPDGDDGPQVDAPLASVAVLDTDITDMAVEG